MIRRNPCPMVIQAVLRAKAVLGNFIISKMASRKAARDPAAARWFQIGTALAVVTRSETSRSDSGTSTAAKAGVALRQGEKAILNRHSASSPALAERNPL